MGYTPLSGSPLCIAPDKEERWVLDWTANDCLSELDFQPGLSEERRHWDKMSLKGPPWQWRRYTVLSGTMTVLTVFRSVSELHKLEQGRAEGVGAKATVHWTNIITTKGTKECMKRAALNDDDQQGNHVLPLHFATEHATQHNLY